MLVMCMLTQGAGMIAKFTAISLASGASSACCVMLSPCDSQNLHNHLMVAVYSCVMLACERQQHAACTKADTDMMCAGVASWLFAKISLCNQLRPF